MRIGLRGVLFVVIALVVLFAPAVFANHGSEHTPTNEYEALYHSVDPGAKCCWSSQWCRAVPAETIQHVHRRLYRYLPTSISKDYIPSPDHRYHICANPEATDIRCIMVPAGSS